MRNAVKVIQSRSRQSIPSPVVHGRNARMGEVGGRGRTSERVDQIICESVHVSEYAKTADCEQDGKCQNGICHIGMFSATDAAMENVEIRKQMKERGYTQADLANLLGIDPTAVSKRLTGKRAFKYDEVRKIEAWLGQGTSAQIGGSAVRMLPIIGQVAAGAWREAVEQPLGHMPVSAASASPNAIVLEVQGDSMDLEIEDGGTSSSTWTTRRYFRGVCSSS